MSAPTPCPQPGDGPVASSAGATSPVSSTLAAMAFDVAPVALAITGPDGRCLQVNRAMCRLVGLPAARLVGAAYRDLTHPDDLYLDEDAIGALRSGEGRTAPIEKRFLHADGHFLWVRVTVTVIRAGGDPVAAVIAAEDIGDHLSRHAELSRLAMHDPLTGVRNRALLDQDIDRLLATRDREGGVVAVLYVDVDDFKMINDAHGHEAGDQALVVLSARLRDVVREEDTVARLGGDEFVLAAHLPARTDAHELRARVAALCDMPVAVGGRSFPLRVSVGMTVVDSTGCSTAQALAAADAGMYADKRDRRATAG